MKFAAAFIALIASAQAFQGPAVVPSSTALFNGPVIGAGGMADTRDPDAYTDADPRKSIGVAPSFEEYLKQRSGAGGAAAPAAPSNGGPPANAFAAAAAPPAPAAPPAYSPPPAAYSPPPAAAPPAAPGAPVIGAGGMADTRDPEAYTDADPRKSIGVAPSFEEYMKQRQ